MDANGARLLALRIRAGVRVGTTIEIVSIPDAALGLGAGDRGVVREITDSGAIVVAWERGFSLELDPDAFTYRPLAA